MLAEEAGREAVACPVCGATATDPHLFKNGLAIVRCRVCDVAFHPCSPSLATLADLYAASYFQEGGFEGYPDYLGDERVHRRQARQNLKRLGQLGLSPGSILDVGCAAGFFLDEARRAGWATAGCDISGYAVGHAREHLGLDVVEGSFVDVDLGGRRFDVITMFSVLAHLPEPKAVLAKLCSTVAPGGYVVVETSNSQALVPRLLGSHWHLCSPPSVLFFHNERSLRRLFHGPHWRQVSYGPAAKWISFEHAVSRLEHRAPARIIAPAMRAVGRSRLARFDVRYPFRDIALAVFQNVPGSASPEPDARP